MAFKNKNFSCLYDLPRDSITYKNDFLIPCFKQSKNYKRASAFFSPNSLIEIKDGIENYINRDNSKIQYIFSNKISEKDFNQIKNGYKERFDDLMLIKWKEEMKEVDIEELSKISYLIKVGLVDIKICIMNNERGMFHSKFGIFTDENNFSVLHLGSNNETFAGININNETIQISLSDKNQEVIDKTLKVFDSWWNNSCDDSITCEIPNLIYKELDVLSKRGELIINKNYIEVDIEDKNIIFINYSKKKIEDEYIYNNKIKNHVNKIDNIYTIKYQKITINNIEEIISYFEKLCIELSIVFVKNRRYNIFISEMKMRLTERAFLGEKIKSKKESELIGFENFKKEISSNLVRVPYLSQFWNMYFMVLMKRSANFSVPGTGKTTVVYGAFSYLKKINKLDKILVIGPKSCFKSWIDEWEENFGYKPNVFKNDATETTKIKSNSLLTLNNSKKKIDLILINFEGLKTYKENLKKIINNKTFLVIDEYHKIKNPKGKQANNVLEIFSSSIYRTCLTGTPVPNGIGDIYNLLEILFDEENEYFGEFYCHKKLRSLSTSEFNRFNNLFYPFFVRTTKKDLNIPDPEPFKIHYCYATNEELKLLKYINKICGNQLVKFIRISQASTCPSNILKKITFEEKDLECFDSPDINILNEFNENFGESVELGKMINDIKLSTKIKKSLDITREILEKEESLITWCILNSTLIEYTKILKKDNISFKVINGSTKFKERERIIDDFKMKKFSVLVTNPQTLAESVSLHKNCHSALYIDYSYNLVHLLQSKDRIHRIGLEKNQKTNYHFIALLFDENNQIEKDNSLDLHILSRLEEKEKLMLEIIEKDFFSNQTSNNLNLNEKELEEIFSELKL